MIYYFSGTGNTKFVADCLADRLNDEIVNMAEYIKLGKELRIKSEKSHVFLAPIYAWRYPRPVEELIRNATLLGCRDVYCITTRESQSGNAGVYMRKIIERNGLTFRGFISVDMPNEYPLSEPVSAPEETKKYLRSILPELYKFDQWSLDFLPDAGTVYNWMDRFRCGCKPPGVFVSIELVVVERSISSAGPSDSAR